MKDVQYDIVSVIRYEGIDNKENNWSFLGNSVVELTDNGKGICFSDNQLEYEYIKSDLVDTNLSVGDIRIKSCFMDSMLLTNATAGVGYLRTFIEKCSLPFVDDSMYATKREINKQKILKTENK